MHHMHVLSSSQRMIRSLNKVEAFLDVLLEFGQSGLNELLFLSGDPAKFVDLFDTIGLKNEKKSDTK